MTCCRLYSVLLNNLLRHIESELPAMMHLPISLDNTFHFHWYLSTYVLIVERLCEDIEFAA